MQLITIPPTGKFSTRLKAGYVGGVRTLKVNVGGHYN
jgi:hypothetical protein